MPELPDVTVYCEALAARVCGEVLQRIELKNPFLLRTVVPPIASAQGKPVREVRRIGKRIVLGLEGGLYLVIHLMIAGRLRWVEGRAKPPSARITLAIFEFASGRLAFTEAGTKRRASLHLVQGTEGLAQFEKGGLAVDEITLGDFAAQLRLENHTLKRALTDPRLFSGIGNAYSDEILHRAGLPPLKLTSRLAEPEVTSLYHAARAVLDEWTQRLRAEARAGFPEKVTAFRPGMAVHGRYGEPCPVCGAPVQRIVYAKNECNYCARCQTGGVILADRALSRLLHDSFPRSLTEE